MRIAIYGAGAIGGYLGVHLADLGVDVTLIARGPHLAAIRERGLRLITAEGERTRNLAATDNPAEAGTQDHVIVTLKAHAAPAIVDAMQPLLAEHTSVVTAMNGIPWWYFHGLGDQWQDFHLESVDPGRRQWNGIGPHRAIGCVVIPACVVESPGVIRHISGDRFVLGEPSGEKTERIRVLADVMREAGLRAPIRARIRDEIWVKLWGNLSFNPVSVLTGATLEDMGSDPETRDVCRAMMQEGQAIGEALGVRFAISLERRIDAAVAVGAHRTSMLQDLDAGRPMEIDAIVTVIQELGRITGIPTPTIDVVSTLLRKKAKVCGLYGN